MTEPMDRQRVLQAAALWHQLEERSIHVGKLVAATRWGIRYKPSLRLYDVDVPGRSVELEYYDHGDTSTLAYDLDYLSMPDDAVVEQEERAEVAREEERRKKLAAEAEAAEQRRLDQERSTWLRLNARAKKEGWA